jgi:hypothetical protein
MSVWKWLWAPIAMPRWWVYTAFVLFVASVAEDLV